MRYLFIALLFLFSAPAYAVDCSALTALSSVSGSECIAVESGGSARRMTPSQLNDYINPTQSYCYALGSETADATTGTKITTRAPKALTITDVRAHVTTAPTGANIVIDINEGGVSILSTKLSIDATEKTSETAATAAVISDSSIADDAEITIDIDQIGSTIAGAGTKVCIYGN